MFRQRQKIKSVVTSTPTLTMSKVLDNGVVTTEVVDPFAELPDAENFKLKNLLKAGVPLEQVNSVIFDSPIPDIDSIAASKSAEPKPADNSNTNTNT